jgi:hypothetical protein
MGAEIPGFDLPKRFSGLTMSPFSRYGIGKLIFHKVKLFRIKNCTIIENRTGPLVCQSGLLTSKLPGSKNSIFNAGVKL